jgi:hypothetical protein
MISSASEIASAKLGRTRSIAQQQRPPPAAISSWTEAVVVVPWEKKKRKKIICIASAAGSRVPPLMSSSMNGGDGRPGRGKEDENETMLASDLACFGARFGYEATVCLSQRVRSLLLFMLPGVFRRWFLRLRRRSCRG